MKSPKPRRYTFHRRSLLGSLLGGAALQSGVGAGGRPENRPLGAQSLSYVPIEGEDPIEGIEEGEDFSVELEATTPESFTETTVDLELIEVLFKESDSTVSIGATFPAVIPTAIKFNKRLTRKSICGTVQSDLPGKSYRQGLLIATDSNSKERAFLTISVFTGTQIKDPPLVMRLPRHPILNGETFAIQVDTRKETQSVHFETYRLSKSGSYWLASRDSGSLKGLQSLETRSSGRRRKYRNATVNTEVPVDLLIVAYLKGGKYTAGVVRLNPKAAADMPTPPGRR